MSLFRRRPKLPAALRPALERDERILAWAVPSDRPATTLDRTEGPSERPAATLDRTEGPSERPAASLDRTEGPSEGGALVATNRGLWLPDGGRLGWHEIHKVAWSGRELRITPAELAQQRDGYTVLVDAPTVGFPLTEPGELPDQVRTRVTRSVAYTSHHPLPPHGGVRVVGRRISGVDGLSWAVRYDAETAVDAEPVVEFTDRLVGAAREATVPPA